MLSKNKEELEGTIRCRPFSVNSVHYKKNNYRIKNNLNKKFSSSIYKASNSLNQKENIKNFSFSPLSIRSKSNFMNKSVEKESKIYKLNLKAEKRKYSSILNCQLTEQCRILLFEFLLFVLSIMHHLLLKV